MKRRSSKRTSKKRLGEWSDKRHYNALHDALLDVQNSLQAARETGLGGNCSEMNASIERAWYNLGKADAHYIAMGKAGTTDHMRAITAAQKSIKLTRDDFRVACVRKKPMSPKEQGLSPIDLLMETENT